MLVRLMFQTSDIVQGIIFVLFVILIDEKKVTTSKNLKNKFFFLCLKHTNAIYTYLYTQFHKDESLTHLIFESFLVVWSRVIFFINDFKRQSLV